MRYTLNMSRLAKTAQDIQDDIFRKMSADKRLEVWSMLWQLAKDIAGNKITYGANRSKNASGEHLKNF